jgi:hypothetical protein
MLGRGALLTRAFVCGLKKEQVELRLHRHMHIRLGVQKVFNNRCSPLSYSTTLHHSHWDHRDGSVEFSK